MEKSELNMKMINATIWSSLAEVCSKLIPPISNIILARLLTPEMFGIVATFTVIISFSDIFTDVGFQKYIIQHEFENENDLKQSINTAFCSNFGLSLIFWFVICCFAKNIANMVGVAGHELGIIVSCIAIPLSSFSSIQDTIFKRKFNFKAIFWVRLITSIVPLIITVPLAIFLKNYWALVIGTLIRQGINVILLTIISPWKPRFEYSYKKFKMMFSFCIWTMFEQISIWLGSNIDIFFIGHFLNQYYLGLYKTSLSTVNSIFMIITAATTPVLFTGLSRTQSNDAIFMQIFYKFQRLSAVIIIPLGFGCLIYRDFLTNILLGKQWQEASVFIGNWSLILATSIIFSYYNSEVFRSKGKPKLSLLVQIIYIMVLIVVLLILIDYGYKGICIARIITAIVLIIVSNVAVKKCFNISPSRMFVNCLPILISSIIMSGVGMVIRNILVGWLEIVGIIVCVVVYFVVLWMFPSIRKEIKNFLVKL